MSNKKISVQEKRERRNALLEMMFESEFRKDETPEEIYIISSEERELSADTCNYLKNIYFDIKEKIEEIDGYINSAAKGWKTSRISKLSLCILRIAVYEMIYVEDVPAVISINEAIELSKKYDDPKAKAFINGVLNKIKDTLESGTKKDD
ncbi:MAG: transcription antitermination factor NusB [Clostridia bacterium]|nr:transcription antitermination factor NusB [Clostridia bacterium]